ncbi:peptidase family C50-domain-containing protein [Entophlyctis helioformis]|nr:peptidase family C50-domain-containing protein [Entophlyctis helioformis]
MDGADRGQLLKDLADPACYGESLVRRVQDALGASRQTTAASSASANVSTAANSAVMPKTSQRTAAASASTPASTTLRRARSTTALASTAARARPTARLATAEHAASAADGPGTSAASPPATAAERAALAAQVMNQLVSAAHDFAKSQRQQSAASDASTAAAAAVQGSASAAHTKASASAMATKAAPRSVSTAALQPRPLRKAASTSLLRSAASSSGSAQPANQQQQQSVFADVAVAIAWAAFAAIEAAATPWTSQSLQLEKFACNLATRLLDCDAFSHAFSVMQYAFKRLGVHRPAAPDGAAAAADRAGSSRVSRTAAPVSAPAPGTSTRSSRTTKSAASTASAALSRVSKPSGASSAPGSPVPPIASDQVAQALDWIKTCPMDTAASASLLQLTMLLLMNALRWVLASPSAGQHPLEYKMYANALLSEHGLAGVVTELETTDAKQAAAHSENIFRILYSHISKMMPPNGLYLGVGVVYYYMRSASFTAKGLHSLIQRPILGNDKALITEPADLILDYYQHITRIVDIRSNFDLDVLSWVDHALNLSKRTPGIRSTWIDTADQLLDIGEQVMPACTDSLRLLRACRLAERAVASQHASGAADIKDHDNLNQIEQLLVSAVDQPAKQQDALPRRLQLSLVMSLGYLRELLDVDASLLAPGNASASDDTPTTAKSGGGIKPSHQSDPSLFASLLGILLPRIVAAVDKMDADARSRATSTVLDLLILKALYAALARCTPSPRIPTRTGACSADALSDFMQASKYGKTRSIDSRSRLLSSSSYQLAALSLRFGHTADAVPLLRLSCDHARDLIAEDPKAVSEEMRIHFAKRFEVLSHCNEELGNVQDARDNIAYALGLFPIAYARKAGDKHTQAFERLLGRYVRLSAQGALDDSQHDHKPVLAIIDARDREVAATVEYIIDLESQMLKGGRAGHAAKLASLAHASTVYGAYGNPLAQARSLLDQARLLRVGQTRTDGGSKAAKCCEQAVAILKPLTLQASSQQQNVSPEDAQHELAIAYCELGISLNTADAFDPKPFHSALRIWKKALFHVPSFSLPVRKPASASLKQATAIKDIERVFAYVEMLCDFFRLLNQPINALYALRLLFKMIQLCPTKTLVDVLGLYREMAMTYLALGCTGKAGIMFSLGKQLADNPKCSASARSAFLGRFGRYLASIGNIEKSASVLAAVDPFVVGQPDLGKDENEAMSRAQTCLDTSYIMFCKGDLPAAASVASMAYGLVAKLARRIQDRSAKGKSKPSLSSNPNKTSRFSCILSHTMMDCCLWLGRVHAFQGSALESEAFLNKGLEAARSANSDGYIAEFSAALADIKARKAQQGDSAVFVQQASSHAAKVEGQLTAMVAASVMIAEADHETHGGSLQRALSGYEGASSELTRAAEEKLVARLEDLPLSVSEMSPAASPRAKSKTLKTAPAAATTLAAAAEQTSLQDPAGVSFTPLAKIKIKGRNDNSLMFRCFGLANLKANVMCKIAHTYGDQSKFEEGWKWLAQVEETDHDLFQEAQYYAALSVSKLQVFLASQRGNQRLQMFADSAYALPWCVPVASVKQAASASAGRSVSSKTSSASLHAGSATGGNGSSSSKAKAPSQFEKSVDQLERLLDHTFQLVQTHGSMQSREDVLFAWTLFQTVKSVLLPGSMRSTASLSILSRLEQAKGVTAERQLRTMRESKRLLQSQQRLREQDPASQPRTLAADQDRAAEDVERLGVQMEGVCLDSDEPGKSDAPIPDAADDMAWHTDPSRFDSDFLQQIPDDLLVCSLSFDIKRQDMYVTRIESGGRFVLFKLPLKRQATREGESDGLCFEQVDAEFKDIMAESRRTIDDAKGQNLSREEVLAWREDRATLDGRMQAMLAQIESVWLGGFKGLLSTLDLDGDGLAPSLELFKKRMETIIFKAVSKLTAMRAKPLAFELDLCKAILRMGATPADDKEIEDVLYYMLDAYQYQGVSVEYDEVNIDSVTEDIKDAIQAFYQEFQLHERQTRTAAGGGGGRRSQHAEGGAGTRRRKHTVLILDKHSQHLPWESLPILRGQPVSRVPSCAMLARLLSTRRVSGGRLTVDPSKAFYVLNPSGDLSRTQSEFEDTMTRERSWSGVIGRPPTEAEFLHGLQSSHVAMYFGHGGAEQYVRGQAIQELDRCAVTLLLGCSSGYLPPAGEFEPQGTALNYMLAGCPALVANLWDVTDRDIDRFSHSLLARWGLEKTSRESQPQPQVGGSVSLVEAVSLARQDTMLKYLIGAAPVVYGLPVHLTMPQ